MTQEEKKLLLKDLCGRLPYGAKIEVTWWCMGEGVGIDSVLEPDHIEQLLNDNEGDVEIRPYLRTKASMTDEEKETYRNLQADAWVGGGWVAFDTYRSIDYLNSIHVDFRGMIEKGLAIQVTPENNPYNRYE